ncbi:hypothetical protein RND81_04G054100 [Saponaria officinalis]|uniref:Uncharacterized protein n=1 Tax=Saponaria officinalis TaxID=3572 RepID=A0AAW1LIB2_SAPOF
MGNFCGISSNKKHVSSPIPQDTELLPGELSTNIIDNTDTITTQSDTPFIVTPDPLGLGVGSSSPSDNMPRLEFVDHRLLSLLEFFRQLHFRRRDIFKQIIPVHRQAFEDIFDKMNNTQEEEQQYKSEDNVLQKSRSSEDLKLDRFKVKPIDSPNDKIKGGGSKPGGPKPAGSK